MSTHDSEQLQQFADPVTDFISDNLRSALSSKKEQQKIQGVKIPSIIPKSDSSEKQVKDNKSKFRFLLSKKGTLKFLSKSKAEQLDHVAQETDQCLAKQDFHLIPFQKVILENTLSKKKVIGWKLPRSVITRKQFEALIYHLCKHSPHKKLKAKLLSKMQKDQLKKETDFKRRQEEQFEVLKLQKEERQFPLTRIISNFRE